MDPPNAYAADLRFRVQHKTLPIPRHESKHPAPACQPTSQTDVIDAHNMAIIAQPMENARQDPDRTTLSASRGDSTGSAYRLMAYFFPPLFSQANSSIDCSSHFASYPAIFLSHLFVDRPYTSFKLSCLFPFFPPNSFFQLDSI
jgi:hypothetical protein